MGPTTDRPEASPEHLEHRIETLRQHLTDTLSELDRRRRALTDLRGQLKQRPGLFAGIGTGLALMIGTAIGYGVWRRRQARRLSKRLERLRAVWSSGVVELPESMGHKVATAAAGALTASLVKQLITRLFLLSEGARPLRRLAAGH